MATKIEIWESKDGTLYRDEADALAADREHFLRVGCERIASRIASRIHEYNMTEAELATALYESLGLIKELLNGKG